jgi:hypothetical protein
MFTYTEDGYTAGSQTFAERKVIFDNDAQAIADGKGEPVTGKYKLPDGSYYTVVKYPAGTVTPPAPQNQDSAPSSYTIGPDTAALIQRGTVQQPGFYGSQENKASNELFNAAVATGAALFGLAQALKAQPTPSPSYVRTKSNYVLTELERQAITRKSQELADVGVVPFDVLENFFYILAVNENLSTLTEISNVVGIPELNNSRYIRNIRGICDITDIWKVGYLANGIASVNQKYATQYTGIQSFEDYRRSSNGSNLDAADLGLALGVIGPQIIHNSRYNLGYSGNYLNNPGFTNDNALTAISSFTAIAQGNGSSLPPTTISAILNPAATMQSEITTIGSSTIAKLANQTPLGGALSALGPLGGIALGALLGKTGGQAIGGFMSEVISGQRISTSKMANNPMLVSPSYAGKAFFGEAPVALPAIDQLFCRRVGAFGTTQGGSGVVSFGMQNFSSFGGALSIASVVSRMVTGSSTPPSTSTYYGEQVASLTSNLCSSLNVSTSSSIEMRRSDNAIPFMQGLSGAIVGETFSPFGSSTFSNGWKLASSTANDIQKYNPRYLEACRTSL